MYTYTNISSGLSFSSSGNFKRSPFSFIHGATLVLEVPVVHILVPIMPTYEIIPSATSINEGDTITLNVVTTNVTDGATLYWRKTSGTAVDVDFNTTLTGTITINSNMGTFNFGIVNDTTTEGSETLVIGLSVIDGGAIVAYTPEITINDTSVTPVGPTYELIPSVTTVYEEDVITFTVNTTLVDDYTTLYWKQSGGTAVVTNFYYNFYSLVDAGDITVGDVLTNSITASPDGKSVYVLDFYNNSIFEYVRNTETGVLTADGSINTDVSPIEMVISWNGTSNAYVICYDNDSIVTYDRNITTGVLTSVASIPTGSKPSSIVISRDGLSVYVINSNDLTISMYARNTTTGELTDAGTIETGNIPKSIAISSDGISVYVVNNGSNTLSIYTRNITTGALTDIGVIATGYQPYSVAVSPDGISVYVANYGTVNDGLSMYIRDTDTGELTYNGKIVGKRYRHVSISPDGRMVYVVDEYNNAIISMPRNKFTGEIIDGGVLDIGIYPAVKTITFSPDSNSIYVHNNTGVFKQFNKPDPFTLSGSVDIITNSSGFILIPLNDQSGPDTKTFTLELSDTLNGTPVASSGEITISPRV
jgi:6-phosphogluconolactonase (cycloisomerase 2 family)